MGSVAFSLSNSQVGMKVDDKRKKTEPRKLGLEVSPNGSTVRCTSLCILILIIQYRSPTVHVPNVKCILKSEKFEYVYFTGFNCNACHYWLYS